MPEVFPNDGFGTAVSLTAELLAIGAPGDRSADVNGTVIGAVYLFTFLGSGFSSGSQAGIIGANYLGPNNFDLKLSSEVEDITKNADGTWRVSYKNLKDGTKTETDAKFVFIGAGGGALHLLQKSGIPEAKEYAGFPVGGSFLVTDNPAIAEQHLAKAYGKASVGAPPMSVPHLDTRVLDGKRVILFGPFATFSTKFLKEGSYLDLLTSTTTHNIWPMTKVGIKEYPLVEYLAGQLMLSDEDRLNALKEYFPNAKAEDWRLWQAGQRVQIIKRDPLKGPVLQFGTEIVTDKDHTLAALLGASPGASVTVSIMLELIEKCFPAKASGEWATKLAEIFPAREKVLETDAALYRKINTQNNISLELVEPAAETESYA